MAQGQGCTPDQGIVEMTAGDRPVLFLPVPSPDVVSAARAYLTPRYAVGLDDFLWDSEQRPLPDLAAIDAVIGASGRAEAGAGDQPSTMDIAAVMVVLAAARQDMDRTEARLLAAARASGMLSLIHIFAHPRGSRGPCVLRFARG